MPVVSTVSCCTSLPSRLSPARTRNTLLYARTACSHLTYLHCISSHHSIDERVSLRSVLAVSSNFPSLKSLAEKLEPTNKPQSRSGSTAGFPTHTPPAHLISPFCWPRLWKAATQFQSCPVNCAILHLSLTFLCSLLYIHRASVCGCCHIDPFSSTLSTSPVAYNQPHSTLGLCLYPCQDPTVLSRDTHSVDLSEAGVRGLWAVPDILLPSEGALRAGRLRSHGQVDHDLSTSKLSILKNGPVARDL
jgi:hypothetical protein